MMTINIQIQAPELASAIQALAEALGASRGVELSAVAQVAATAPKAAPAQPKETTHVEPAPPTETKPDKDLPTLEDVRAKLASLSRAGKQAQVKKLIQQFGAERLTDIPATDYPAVLAAAELL